MIDKGTFGGFNASSAAEKLLNLDEYKIYSSKFSRLYHQTTYKFKQLEKIEDYSVFIGLIDLVEKNFISNVEKSKLHEYLKSYLKNIIKTHKKIIIKEKYTKKTKEIKDIYIIKNGANEFLKSLNRYKEYLPKSIEGLRCVKVRDLTHKEFSCFEVKLINCDNMKLKLTPEYLIPEELFLSKYPVVKSKFEKSDNA